jgi:signal transduction histidine kinase
MRRPGLVLLVGSFAVAGAALVTVVFLISLVAVTSLRSSNLREARSKDVTADALRLETLAVDLESGVRGYVITGRRPFLTPFQRARRAWPGAARRLSELVADDPVQAARVARVDSLTRAYISDYALPVIQIAHVSLTAASSSESAAEGNRRLAAIRRVLERVLTTERLRSQERAAAARRTARRAVLAGVAGLTLSALVMLVFGAWVTRAVARPVREAAEAAAAVAGGDFATRLPTRGAGEVAALANAFNAMTRALDEGRQALLRQNAQLQASERHKSDLISMVSHELRTPLASVLGFTSLLIQRDFPVEEQRRYLEIVDREARRLAALAEDFLDVRLLEEGRFDFDLEAVDLVTVVREQALVYFGNAPGHRLDLDVPLDLVVVDGDRDRIAQVVGNLLSNAIKYSPEGGTVEVKVDATGGRARVTVVDHGLGIRREHQERIFERFFRGAAPEAGIGGTGIGLAVARDIVEAHGGTLGFRSAEGTGSTFWIELPLHAEAHEAA